MEYQAFYQPDMQSSGILDLQLLMRFLDKQLPTEKLLSGSELTREQIFDSSTHVSYRQKQIIFNNALTCANTPGLGLRIGQQARFSDFGMLGYAIFSSDTLLDALLMGFKYLRLAGPVLSKRMWVEGEQGYFRGEQLIDLGDMLPFYCEYWFTAIKSLCEEVMQAPFPAIEFHFPYPEPSYSALYHEVFGCPVFFESDRLEWRFHAKALYEPLPTANAITLQQCLRSCDELLAQSIKDTPLKERIYQLFLDNPAQYPSIEEIAAELGMSSRTLRRHLKREGTSYQALLNDVRFYLARHYLSSTQITIEEISSRIGFADSASFRHAFRKWSGHCASEFRKSPVNLLQ